MWLFASLQGATSCSSFVFGACVCVLVVPRFLGWGSCALVEVVVGQLVLPGAISRTAFMAGSSWPRGVSGKIVCFIEFLL